MKMPVVLQRCQSALAMARRSRWMQLMALWLVVKSSARLATLLMAWSTRLLEA